jgi:phosphoglycolate phosphatase
LPAPSDREAQGAGSGNDLAGQTVLFDLDGTISDSAPGILASLRAMFAELGIEWMSDETARTLLGPPFTDTLPRYVGGDRLAEAITRYRRHYVDGGAMYDAQVYPGIAEVLQDLAGRGARLAVATSKAEPYARLLLEHLRLDGFFATIGGDTLDGGRGSKALVIEEVLARLRHPDASTVTMVGDRSQDVLGAAAHGLSCVGALWGYGSAAELTAAGASRLCQHPLDLSATLGQRVTAADGPAVLSTQQRRAVADISAAEVEDRSRQDR